MKKALLISLVIMLSTLTLVESIGMYVTKNICAPCGDSSIELEFISTNDNNSHCSHHHLKTTTHQNHDACCNMHHTCHNQVDHHHKKVHHYINLSPDFFYKVQSPSFDSQLLAVLLPIIHTSSFLNKEKEKYIGGIPPPLLIPKEDYLSFICTYLI